MSHGDSFRPQPQGPSEVITLAVEPLVLRSHQESVHATVVATTATLSRLLSSSVEELAAAIASSDAPAAAVTGDNLIGFGTTVVGDVRVGRGAVVDARSLVTQVYPVAGSTSAARPAHSDVADCDRPDRTGHGPRVPGRGWLARSGGRRHPPNSVPSGRTTGRRGRRPRRPGVGHLDSVGQRGARVQARRRSCRGGRDRRPRSGTPTARRPGLEQRRLPDPLRRRKRVGSVLRRRRVPRRRPLPASCARCSPRPGGLPRSPCTGGTTAAHATRPFPTA